MKLLLTSFGIHNKSLAGSLEFLVGKKPSETKIGFIPTAVNVDNGNKDWFIEQLTDLQKFGYNQIDIVEIASKYVDWKGKLEAVDVIYTGGGNPFYLIHIMREVGFDYWLKNNLDNKVYVGGSSGAIILSPTINIGSIKTYDVTNVSNITDFSGISLVDFEIAPHVPDWPSYEEVEEYAKTTKNQIYAIDDESGIQVIDNEVKVISEGRWKKYN